MKCQILLSGKIKRNISKYCLLKFSPTCKVYSITLLTFIHQVHSCHFLANSQNEAGHVSGSDFQLNKTIKIYDI